LAKISALSYKAKDNAIVVVEDPKFEAPKTKSFVSVLKALNVDNKKTLFVSAEPEVNVELSLRNIPSVLGVSLSELNTYDIVNADVLVLTESAAKIFTEEEVPVEA